METTQQSRGPAAPDAEGARIAVEHPVAAPPEQVWRSLMTEWLPERLAVDSVPQMVGAPIRDGGTVRGRVLGCHVGRRLRLRWVPPELGHETLVQISLTPILGGTAVRLSQEHLRGPAEQQSARERWTAALAGITAGR